MNGNIILIKGNHDFRNGCQSEAQYNELFEFSTQQLLIEIEGRKVYLNHVPFLCYGGKGEDIERLKYLFPTQYDVGVDNNDYTPISWYEVEEKIGKQLLKSKFKK